MDFPSFWVALAAHFLCPLALFSHTIDLLYLQRGKCSCQQLTSCTSLSYTTKDPEFQISKRHLKMIENKPLNLFPEASVMNEGQDSQNLAIGDFFSFHRRQACQPGSHIHFCLLKMLCTTQGKDFVGIVYCISRA